MAKQNEKDTKAPKNAPKDNLKNTPKIEKVEKAPIAPKPITAEVHARTLKNISRRDMYVMNRLYSKQFHTAEEWNEKFKQDGLI